MASKHKILYALVRPIAAIFAKIKFGYKYKKQNVLPDENYIVLSNHCTDFDPIFVALAFSRQMYFVASEHITRWPRAYKLINYIFEPIIRHKGAIGAAAVMKIMRKVRKGENVCIFAEGARSWDGVTAAISPSTAQLIKASKCGLVTFKLSGGYFVSPVWSKGRGTRRGDIRGEIAGVYTKEQIANMTEGEILDIITRDLHEDAYARQLAEPKRYHGKRLAERLETLLFICPECLKNGTLKSQGDTVRCSCGHSFKYDEYGMLHGTKFQTLKDFASWQRERVQEDVAHGKTYEASGATLKLIDKASEITVAEGMLKITNEKIIVGEHEIEIAAIPDMDIHGNNALVFSTSGGYYEIIPSESDCALKFLWFFEEQKALTAKKQIANVAL